MQRMEPEQLGLSSERLGRVSTWLAEQIDQQRLAGASIQIGRRGSIAFEEAVGWADVERKTAFSLDTIVRIYSMTKPITTVAAMMLYEAGCFQLDHPVGRYIPAFKNTPVWTGGDVSNIEAQASPMTVKQLMTHTSGLTYGFMNSNVIDQAYRERGFEARHGDSLETWVNKLAEVPLLCQPGSQWNYSVSTDVLGRLVEIWSGQSLADFFAEHIFKPLGMTDSGFSVPESEIARFCSMYGPTNGAVLGGALASPFEDRAPGIKRLDDMTTSAYRDVPAYLSGGGGLVSTLADYGRFCSTLLGGGALEGNRILSPKTLEFMRLNQLPENRDMAAMGQPIWSETTYEGIGFGIGWAVVIDPATANIVTSAGEHHWGGAASTFFWIDPIEDLYVVFLTQLMPSSTYPLRRELRARVYQSLID
jgi:CubicO group peptidase (beta-lactamase class C family)